MPRAVACELPPESRLRDSLPRLDYVDSYAVPAAHPHQTMIEIYASALDHLPTVFAHLLVLRSAIVKPFGIRGVSFEDLTKRIDTAMPYAVGQKIGRWTIFGQYPDELITGANDRHLDFRVSVLREKGARIVLSTAVMTHNTLGRAYLAAILPFHRFGVGQILTRASVAGRL